MRKIFSTVFLSAVALACALMLNGFIFFPDTDSIYGQIKNEILKQANAALTKEVKIGGVSGNLISSITLNNVSVGEDIIVEKIIVHYNLLRAGFSADILPAVYRIDIVEPNVLVLRDSTGDFNLAKLFPPPKPGEKPATIPIRAKINIISGTAQYIDNSGFAQYKNKVENLRGTLDLSIKNKIFIYAKGILNSAGKKNPIGINGNFNFFSGVYKFNIDLKDGDIKDIGSYVLNIPNFKFIGGLADVDLTIKSSKGKIPFSLDGKINVKEADLGLFGYNVSKINGLLSLKKEEVKFDGLSGELSQVPITLNGKISDFEKLNFDLKITAKDSQIENVLKISGYTKNIDLRGIGNTEVNISGSAAQPKVWGNLKIIEGILYRNPVSGDCKFEFGKNNLNIKVPCLNMFKGSLAADINLNFSSRSPRISAKANVLNIDIGAATQNVEGISGRTSGRISAHGSFDDLLMTWDLNMHRTKIFGQDISHVQARLNVIDGGIKLKELKILGSGFTANASGTIDKDLKFLLSANCKGYKFNAFAAPAGKIAGKIDEFEGIVSGDINYDFLSRPYKKLSAKGAIRLSDLQVRSQHIKEIKGTFDFENNSLKIPAISVTENESTILISGEAGIGSATKLHFDAGKVLLSDLSLLKELLPAEISRVDGMADIKFDILGNIPKDTKIEEIDWENGFNIEGTFSAKNGIFGDQPFEDTFLNFEWDNSTLTLAEAFIKTPDSNITFTGAIDLDGNLNISGNGFVDLINLHNFTAKYGRILGKAKISGNIRGNLQNPQIACEYTAAGVKYNNISVDSVSGKIEIKNKLIILNNSTVIEQDLDSYRLYGQINISERTPYINLKIDSIKGGFQSVANIANMFISEFSKQKTDSAKKPEFNASPISGRHFTHPMEYAKNDHIDMLNFLKYWDGIFATYTNYEQSFADLSKVDASGTLAGSLKLEGYLSNLSADIDVSINNGKYQKYKFDKLTAKIKTAGEKVSITNLEIGKSGGYLKISGTTDTKKLSIKSEAKNMPLDFLKIVNPSLPTDGLVNINATIGGFILSPEVFADFKIVKLSWNELYLEKISGSVSSTKDSLKVKRIDVDTKDQTSSFSGSIPLNSSGQIDFDINLKGKNVGILANIFKGTKWLKGDGIVDLNISGSISQPKINGKINVSNGMVNIDTLDSHIEALAADIIIKDNFARINKLYGILTGKFTRDISDTIDISGTINLDNIVRTQTIGIALNLKDSNLNINLAEIFNGAVSTNNFSVTGDFPLISASDSSLWPKISGNFNIHDSVIYLPKGQGASKNVIPVQFNTKVNLGKNVYVVQGETSRTFAAEFSNMNLQVESEELNIAGGLNSIKIYGDIFIKSGIINILTRDFSIVPAGVFGKTSQNSASFSGSVLPKLNVLAMTKTQDVKKQSDGSSTTTNVDIFSKISGIPFSDNAATALKIEFEAYTEDTSKKPVELIPAKYTDSEIKVMLLPDYLKGALGLTGDSQKSLDTNAVLADYLNSRLSAVVLRSVERQMERTLGLESFSLEYNFGKDLERATGTQRLYTDQTKWGVGFVKGFFDRLYINFSYKQAMENATVAKNDALNYQITWKISPGLSINYYREPWSFQEQLSTYFKTTLNYGYRF